MNDTPVTRSRSPEEDEAIHVIIVELIGELADADPAALPTLAHSIDIDALERLYAPESPPRYPELAFDHVGYHVYVTHERHVVVQELE